MLHILLTILKILGIVLLVFVAAIVLLLIIVLFVPIRYRIKAQKDADIINGKARVSWLFGILAFVVLYKEKGIELQVRILGINIMRLLKKLSKPKESNAISSNKNENKEENINEISKSVQDKSVIDIDQIKRDTNKGKEKESILLKIKNIIPKIKSSISKIKLTIRNIYDKINYWKDFISDQRTKDAFGYVKKHVIRILKHIMPKRLKGTIEYGFDDPCKTGQILAGVSMFYPLYYKSLSLHPDFSGSVLNGHIDLKGRIYVIFFVKSAILILFNKNIQYIIHTFRNKEAS